MMIIYSILTVGDNEVKARDGARMKLLSTPHHVPRPDAKHKSALNIIRFISGGVRAREQSGKKKVHKHCRRDTTLANVYA